MAGDIQACATKQPGWVGTMGQLKHYLRTVGADQDPDGRFFVAGAIVTFLGLPGDNTETLVSADAVYFVGGNARPLAAGLHATSYGSKAIVIA